MNAVLASLKRRSNTAPQPWHLRPSTTATLIESLAPHVSPQVFRKENLAGVSLERRTRTSLQTGQLRSSLKRCFVTSTRPHFTSQVFRSM